MLVAGQRPIARITEGDLRLLRIFRVIAEEGGLTAAERKLDMERSTISRHLKALEERLGGRLCERGPTGFILTDFGHVALRVSVAAGDTLDRARDEINLARNQMTGELLVGLPDNCLTNPRSPIAKAIGAFQQRAPDVKLQLYVRPPNELMTDLLDRRLHLCIVGKMEVYKTVVFKKLFHEEFRLYVSGGGNASAPHIDDLNRLGYSLVSRANTPHANAVERRLKLDRFVLASGLEAVATFLVSGKFVALLPTHYASLLATRLDLLEVQNSVDFKYKVWFHLASVSDRLLPVQAQAFHDLLTEFCI